MKWSYGVTTCAERVPLKILQDTLDSLAGAGFISPIVFQDGQACVHFSNRLSFQERVIRTTQLRPFGNWVLAAWELYLRQPRADRFVIFQDDLLASKNLREYLEECVYPKERGYYNLYTFPHNDGADGWHLSDQWGKSAVGLMFDNEGIRTLLSQRMFIDRPLDPVRGWKCIDGGVIDCLKTIGYKEYVHTPSLLQHTGDLSTIGPKCSEGPRVFPKSLSFKGEQFDLKELLCKTKE